MNDDIHALSGAYAVDALEREERELFERHLAECPACRDEVASLQTAAGQLAGLVETTPPAALRDSVLGQISTVRPLPPTTAATSRTISSHGPVAPRAPLPMRSRLIAAVAAALLVIGGLAVWRAVDTSPPPTVAEQVLDAPDASRLAHQLPGGATATIVRSKEVGRAVLITSHLPAPPSGKVYQLWLQDPAGTMQPAGLMTASGDQVVVLAGNARDAIGAGITIEPAGGSLQPTTKPLALFAFS